MDSPPPSTPSPQSQEMALKRNRRLQEQEEQRAERAAIVDAGHRYRTYIESREFYRKHKREEYVWLQDVLHRSADTKERKECVKFAHCHNELVGVLRTAHELHEVSIEELEEEVHEMDDNEDERWEKYWKGVYCAARERRKRAATQRQREEKEKQKAEKERGEKKEQERLEALEMCRVAGRLRLASLRSSVSTHGD